MKKTITMLFVVLCAVMAQAQSYGILVNDKMYYAGENNPNPGDPSFQEYMVLGLSLKSGDKCKLYDYNNEAGWVVPLDTYSTPDITMGNGVYVIGKDACYDFYIKLKYENDQLYVGGDAACKDPQGIDITSGDKPQPYAGSAPAKCTDVVFQAFYWDSYQDKGYGRTKWKDYLDATNGTSATEIGQWFDLVWLPPMSKATGGTGYHPTNYSKLDSDWGTKKNLLNLIYTLHLNGAKVVADIVVNHFSAEGGYCDKYGTYNFGEYGTFEPDGSWICSTDEMNYEPAAGDCKGKATGNPDDGYGDEANYASARDWDHNSAKVRNMIKAYLKWLRYEIGVDGFRYDYCKGFHNSHINDYNSAAQAYFSVMEMWDGDVNVLQSHLNDAGWNTTTFDFATKYQAFNNGIAAGNYAALKGAGLLGAGKSRYACTFLDSHDSFQRDNNEFCGLGNSMKYPGKIQQCYAYLLSMPGVPLVFFPHWVKFKEPIKAMINARYKTGVHSESAVSDEAGNGFYKATITGTNGEIRLLLGPNSGYATTPSGYTKAVTGENYGVYYKTNSARGDKNKERKEVGVEQVEQDKPAVKGDKFIENGKLYIRCNGQVFDATGSRVR